MTPSTPIAPKKPGQTLPVIVLGRISTAGQDLDSIASRHAEAERWLRENYDGPADVRRLGEQASGNLADRPSAVEAREQVSAGRRDLGLVGELREIFRAPHLLWGFFYTCVDHGVRVIAVADNVDTADENWETMLHVGGLKAGLAVPEARRRVRRKATFSFNEGGMVLKVRYGYRRLTKEEAATGEFGPRGCGSPRDRNARR